MIPTAMWRGSATAFPNTRGKSGQKAFKNLVHAHWFICGWRVLEKAVYRKDVLAYQQARSKWLTALVAALYAINRVWQESRRRLRFCSRHFGIIPEGFLERLESIILRKGRFQDLECCHLELRTLFRDLCVLASERYPEWHLPTNWHLCR